MDLKFDGTNIYSVLTIMVAKLVDQADQKLKNNSSKVIKLEKTYLISTWLW